MWKRSLISIGLVITCNVAQSQIIDDERILARGDANNDGHVNLSDATTITTYFFLGGPAPPCMNQADANNDGRVDVTDAVYLLAWLYTGQTAPPWPGPYNTTCKADDVPYPGCETDPCT